MPHAGYWEEELLSVRLSQQIYPISAACDELIDLWKTTPPFVPTSNAALQYLSYHAREAGSGEAALAACEPNPGKIDLVMTDLVMPGWGGHELIYFGIHQRQCSTPQLDGTRQHISGKP